MFGQEWSDPLLYDPTLVTDRMTLDTAVGQVLAVVAAPESTDASRRALGDRALAARIRAALASQ